MVAIRGREFPLERRSLSEQIYEVLERQILAGELAPGTKLSEEGVAAEFGVSRSPAREALSELERSGLAVRSGGRDRAVALPTPEWIREAFDVFWLLDVGQSYLSSLRATVADHDRLYVLLDEMKQARRRGDEALRLERYHEFHDLLTCRCDNRKLALLIQNNARYIDWFKALYFEDLDNSERADIEHRQIVDCYVAKDLPGLMAVARTHIMHTRDRILARLMAMEETTH